MKKKEMNKKQKRERDLLKKSQTNYDPNVMKIIIISIGVIICFVLIYLVTALATGELTLGKKKEEKPEVEIQNIERLAGETFEIKQSEYIMMYFDFKRTDSEMYFMLYEEYVKSSSNVLVYMVDLNNGFNKPYVRTADEKYTKNPKNISELKLSNPTVIRIKDGKIVKYIENREDIIKYFEGL